MKKLKVVNVDSDSVEFENGVKLYSNHDQDCCESHYLDFSDLKIEDFKDLEFDLTNDDFFERIEDYGIALKPINGFPVRIPGYGSNNGYYIEMPTGNYSKAELEKTRYRVITNEVGNSFGTEKTYLNYIFEF